VNNIIWVLRDRGQRCWRLLYNVVFGCFPMSCVALFNSLKFELMTHHMVQFDRRWRRAAGTRNPPRTHVVDCESCHYICSAWHYGNDRVCPECLCNWFAENRSSVTATWGYSYPRPLKYRSFIGGTKVLMSSYMRITTHDVGWLVASIPHHTPG
jgi:hypothetical protein